MLAKSTRTTRLVAVITLILGLGWVWATLINPLLHPITPTDGASVRPILIVMLLVLALPGFSCLFFGIDLLRQVRIRAIKGTVGSLLVAIVVWIVSALVGLLAAARSELAFSLALIFGTVLALPAYAAACQALLRREGFVVPGTRELMGRSVVLLVALQIWWLANLLFTTYSPRQPGDPDLLAQPWPVVALVVPILIAIAFYKISNAALGNSKSNPAPIPQER